MHRLTPIALLCATCIAILSWASSAQAVQITKHRSIRDPLTHKVIHAAWTVDVPPPDSDDDGCADQDDNYNGPGCNPPPPPPEPAPAPAPEVSAPAPAPTTTTTSSGGYSIPSYIVECESGGSYTAQNPSGAYGAYQIMPGTASAYGCDLSTASGQDQCAAEIYADVGSSAWSCG
jgi:hypothetical protein